MENFCLLTCEHASYHIPRQFHALFAHERSHLKTHQGYDIGARYYAEAIAQSLSCPVICGHVSRLLVDLNRSLHNPTLFSHITKDLDMKTQQVIIARYYTPFRAKARQIVEQKIREGKRVIHISCHSFSPILGKVERKMDLGILYNPKRSLEKAFSNALRQRLVADTSMCIRLNAPYRGVSDGHVSALRKIFSPETYMGIELEISQAMYSFQREEIWKHVWLPRLIEELSILIEEFS